MEGLFGGPMEALRQSEERFRLLVEGVVEAQPVDCLVGGMTHSGKPMLGLCWLLRPAKGG